MDEDKKRWFGWNHKKDKAQRYASWVLLQSPFTITSVQVWPVGFFLHPDPDHPSMFSDRWVESLWIFIGRRAIWRMNGIRMVVPVPAAHSVSSLNCANDACVQGTAGRSSGGWRRRSVELDECDGCQLLAELLQDDDSFQQRHVIDTDRKTKAQRVRNRAPAISHIPGMYETWLHDERSTKICCGCQKWNLTLISV